jgi:hypothetical protein
MKSGISVKNAFIPRTMYLRSVEFVAKAAPRKYHFKAIVPTGRKFGRISQKGPNKNQRGWTTQSLAGFSQKMF